MLSQITPSVAGELLRRHRVRAGRRHGQHFLVDPNTVRKIVRLADVQPDETILEIGPGLGSLTVVLAPVARRVVCIELDRGVAAILREVLGDAANVELVVGDAMRVDLPAIVGSRARIVANLPYNVATPLILRLLRDVPQVSGGLVMVQRELGERWTATPRTHAYNSVSARVAYHAEARIVADVPPSVFMPPPKVSSVLVSFTRRTVPAVEVDDPARFFRFLQSAFGHRRKTLRNSLVSAGFDREAVDAALTTCAIPERARPEDLGLDEYARLDAALAS